MASLSPLKGTDLIDCAKANAKQGIEVAAERCGYGNDLVTFEKELRKAGDYMNIQLNTFGDLLTNQIKQEPGEIVAPESPTVL